MTAGFSISRGSLTALSDWKSCGPARVPEVRILSSPLKNTAAISEVKTERSQPLHSTCRPLDRVMTLPRQASEPVLPHDVIRLSPETYLEGDESRSLAWRLLRTALRLVAGSKPTERNVRVVVWKEHAFTIGFDGPPLPIESVTRFDGDLPHPSLYDLVMAPMVPGGSRRTVGAALINALSERMVVATVHGDVCYRARFRRGCVASLLKREEPREIFGESWLTFEPDASVVQGEIALDDVRGIVAEIARDASGVSLEIVDRSADLADW